MDGIQGLIKALRPLVIAALVVTMFASCEDEPIGVPVQPLFAAAALASVELDRETLDLRVGESATVNCQPRDAAGNPVSRNCNWRTRNAAVATVTGNGTRIGTVTGAAGGTTWIVANAEQSRDSVRVTVGSGSPPPAGIVAVVLTPASSTLPAAGVQQFAASGRNGSGDEVPVTATWTATGGTIDGSGRYTAGETAGEFRVIARVGTMADTSAITITGSPLPPPPPPPGTALRGCPSDGYTRLVEVSGDGQLSPALANAQPGDQIRLAAGTYSGARSWSRSGTASAPITLCGQPGVGPIIKGGMFSSSGSYLVFTGLIFEGAASVENRNNIYLNNAHHLIFTGNEIRGGHYHAGLSTDEVNNVTITFNYIHHNGRDNSHDHGIYFKTTTGPGNLIANNLLVANAARGISLHDNSGAGVYDVLVTHNTIVGNGSTGLLVNDGDRVTVVNNISAYNGDRTGQRQIRVLAGNGNQVRNNLTYSATSSRAGIENSTASPMSGNVVGEPRFVASPTNLHLQVGSPALGLGLAAFSQPVDFEGVARGDPPTAGAFER